MNRSRKSDIKSSINTSDGASFFYTCLVFRLSFKESRYCMFAHSMLAKLHFFFKWIKANKTSKRHLCMHFIIDLRLVCPSLHVNHKDTYPWALLKGNLVSQHEHAYSNENFCKLTIVWFLLWYCMAVVTWLYVDKDWCIFNAFVVHNECGNVWQCTPWEIILTTMKNTLLSFFKFSILLIEMKIQPLNVSACSFLIQDL